MTTQEQLISKQEEYIKLLGDEMKGFAAYLHIHGMHSSVETIEKGKELRAEMEKLKALIESERIEPSERERQVAISYHLWLTNYHCGNYTKLYNDFIESESFLSIPPATNELREKIEARIKELKNHIGFAYATKDRIDELENILKS
jgi:hypothetical protein